MLAKQTWRFVTNPSSLCSRTFKARYFPKSDFFGADLGHNLSYAWRSIVSTKSVILAGAHRKIRNGKDAKTWGSPWLLNKDQPCIQSTMPNNVKEVTFDALFILGQLQWDALSDNLPTKGALIARKMDMDPTCGHCNIADETILHTLVLCPVVQHVWHSLELGLWVQIANSLVK
ncbi:hypothetical protein LguiA_034931 [Lonicera macranthoides]